MLSKPILVSVSFLFCLILMSAPVESLVIKGPITNPLNSHLYYELSGSTWTVAETEAVSLGGHLVAINDQAENDFVTITFASNLYPLWIGFTDSAQEGTWVWVSGESVTYTNWISGEPNNWGGNEHYATLNYPDGKWNDVTVTSTTPPHGVVEVVVPDPSTLWLFGTGIIGFAALRRKFRKR